MMTTKKDPASLASARLWRRARCWLCRALCGDQFFNLDASREIDALTIELEKIRAGGKKCRPTI